MLERLFMFITYILLKRELGYNEYTISFLLMINDFRTDLETMQKFVVEKGNYYVEIPSLPNNRKFFIDM